MLGAASPLPVEIAEDGARFQGGRIYAVPKDVLMLISDGRITLRRGPRENMARPAINPLFRTAASAYGWVLLSGLLYNGAAGMRAVARCGGITVVQDPDDALYPEMPRNALEHVDVAHCEPAPHLGQLLVRLVNDPAAVRAHEEWATLLRRLRTPGARQQCPCRSATLGGALEGGAPKRD